MKNFGDPIWEKIFNKREWGKYPYEEVIKFYMLASKKYDHSPNVLDIGAGIGAHSWFMNKEGGNVTALEGSNSALKKIKKIQKEFNVLNEIEVVKGNITMPLKILKKKYDILLDNLSLCVNDEDQIENAFKEYYAIMNSKGHFLTISLGEKSTGYKTGSKLSTRTWKNISSGAMKDRGMITWYNAKYLKKLFTKIGFSITSYSNILQNINGIIVEKNIFHLQKN